MLNSSNTTVYETEEIALAAIIFYYIDFVMRSSFLLSHIAYFLVVISYPELQKMTLFQMHHVNICGLCQSILYSSWLGSIEPGFNDPNLNFIVCNISEFCSSVFKYSRSYSILVLAFYRLYAVKKFSSYMKFANNLKATALTGAINWIIPIILFFSNKYATGSEPGYFCADGNYSNSFLYTMFKF